MSSGFVSSGKLEPDGDEITSGATEGDRISHNSASEPSGVDAWAAADAAIKAAREAQMKSSGLVGSQDGGQSLFEVLQANKARKQEAFEEKLKFKNQFRSLDDDEIEFLDSIASEKLAEEAEKKKELESRLDDFRKLQYEVDHDPSSISGTGDNGDSNTWAVPARRKRKKEKEKDGIGNGLKLRKMSDGSKKEGQDATVSPLNTTETKLAVSPQVAKAAVVLKSETQESATSKTKVPNETPDTEIQKPNPGLGGLVGYGSDSDDD